MLVRKISVCSVLFILMLTAGWALEYHIETNRERVSLPMSSTAENRYRTLNSAKSEQLAPPFLPREYVRIVHRKGK